jgi:hypothetical protein
MLQKVPLPHLTPELPQHTPTPEQERTCVWDGSYSTVALWQEAQATK